MPMGGIDEWDRPGGPFHDPDGLARLARSLQKSLRPEVPFIRLDAHLNDRPIVTLAATAALTALTADAAARQRGCRILFKK